MRLKMIKLLRSVARRVFPRRLRPIGLVTARLLQTSGGKVMQGPFCRLRIVVDPTVIDWPKLLGTYEMELHPLFERIVAVSPPTVVNIGAAEGYYAAGLAVRCPATRVIACEERPGMQLHIAQVAAANGVADRVKVEGRCDAAELGQILVRHPGSLLLVDVEGGEIDLLDPERIPVLATCPMLVEEHDLIQPGCTQALLERFGVTHHVEIIRERPRRDWDLPVNWPLGRRWLRRLMQENRLGPQTWLYLVPKSTVIAGMVLPERA